MEHPFCIDTSPGFTETQRSTSASWGLFGRRASREALLVTTMGVASLEIWFGLESFRAFFNDRETRICHLGLKPLLLARTSRMGVHRQTTFIAVLLACLVGANGYSAAPGELLCASQSLPPCDVAVIGTIIRVWLCTYTAVHSLRMPLLRIDGCIDVWLHVLRVQFSQPPP